MSATRASPPAVITRTGHALGTTVSLTIVVPDDASGRSRADRAMTAAFAELDLIEDILSLYRTHSQLSRLNREGLLDQPHPYLLQVLQASLDMSRRSDGAFDVTIQPLWRLHADSQKQGRPPDADELNHCRRAVDWRRIEVMQERIRFRPASDTAAPSPSMAITFNGIAQGFAVDRVKTVLRSHGVEHALLDVGELAALGTNADARPWTVGIQHPRQADAYAALTRLDARCLATSGDYASTFAGDSSSHHLLDPRTGRSPGELSSVSVLAATAMEADALSTALFVLGVDRGLDLVRHSPGVDVLFIHKDGRQQRTPGFPQLNIS